MAIDIFQLSRIRNELIGYNLSLLWDWTENTLTNWSHDLPMLPYTRFSNFHFDIQEFSNIIKCFLFHTELQIKQVTEYFVIKILIKQNWTHSIDSPHALDMSCCIGSYIRYKSCCNVVPWTYTCTIRWVRVWSLKRWHLFQPRHSVEEESSGKIHWQIMA